VGAAHGRDRFPNDIKEICMADKITPFLWFNGNAEEAVKFYTSIFKKSKIGRLARYPEGGPGKPGSVMTIEFKLEGRDYVALNGGPEFKFTEALSLVVNVKDQKELDHYWDKLLAGGGTPVACGWLKDRFGLSWQVVPELWVKLYSGKDKARAQRVFSAMMKMVKLDIAALQRAAKGK
jgi:predicted 3-demethylubiquinone-9 3-methyltransferase (glyoxalase superfamily)